MIMKLMLFFAIVKVRRFSEIITRIDQRIRLIAYEKERFKKI